MPKQSLELSSLKNGDTSKKTVYDEFDKLVCLAERLHDALRRRRLFCFAAFFVFCEIVAISCFLFVAVQAPAENTAILYAALFLFVPVVAAMLALFVPVLFRRSIFRYSSMTFGYLEDELSLNEALNLIHELYNFAQRDLTELQKAEMRIRLSRLPIGDGLPRRN